MACERAAIAMVAAAAAAIWLGESASFAQSAPTAPASSSPSAASSPPAESAPPVSLARIRNGLRKESVIDVRPDVPVFRTEVEAHVIKLKPYWKDDSTAVASYVRSSIPRGHHEYLQNVFGMTGNTGRLPFEAANNPAQFVTTPIFSILSTGFIDILKETLAERAARKKAEAEAARARAAAGRAAEGRAEAAAPAQPPKPRETPPN